MADKVFCEECKWFRSQHNAEFCEAPSNKQDTYRRRGGSFLRYPAAKNERNDCKDYEASPSVETAPLPPGESLQ